MGVAGSTASGAVAGATIGSIVPGVGTVIGAGVGAVAGMIGGLVGSSQAKSQAAFSQKMLEEQIRVNDVLYAREIRGKLGENLVGAAARGVSQSGSVIDSAFDEAFTLQLQRSTKNLQLRAEQLQADVTGKQKSQAALLGGLKSGLEGTATAVDAAGTSKKIADAKNAADAAAKAAAAAKVAAAVGGANV
jgi:hypothetical protein